MSWQAMEAVLEHSGFQERRDYSLFRVLLAIASFADENGVAGVPGQHLACPTHRAIAVKARVHRNTVGNLLPQLVESGELTVEQGGWAGSLWTVYQICLPGLSNGTQAEVVMAEEEAEARGPGKSDDRNAQFGTDYAQEEVRPTVESLVGLVGQLAEGMGRLQGELAQMREAMAESRGGNAQDVGEYAQNQEEYAQSRRGYAQNRDEYAQNREGVRTTVQRGVVPDPIRDPGDPDRDPGAPRARDGAYRVLHEESPPFSADQSTSGEGEPGGLDGNDGPGKRATVGRDLVRPALDGVGRRRAGAIAEVCGLDMRVRSHRKRCEEAAMQLNGYPEAYILARYGVPDAGDGAVDGWNWYLHDWRGRRGEQPEPRLVVETIGKGVVGPEHGTHNRQDAVRHAGGGTPTVMSNNEATARKYAELRRKMMED